MTDEDTNKTEQAGEETPKIDDKPISKLDEARKLNEENTQLLKELREERQKLEELKSDEILSGDNGGAVKVEPPKEISPEDYAKAALAGENPDVKEE